MSTFARRAAVFILGFSATVAQVVFFRELLVVFLGNELCTGVLFFSWFLGVGLGASASARAAGRAASGEGAFALLGCLLAATAPLLLVLIRLSRGILGVPVGEYIPFAAILVAAWFLVIPFSFLVGFAFPFACLLPLGRRGGAVGHVGRAYVAESLGSIAGGALFSFFLVGRVPSAEILVGCGAAMLLSIFFVSLGGGRRGAAWTTGILAAAWIAALACGAAGRLESWSIARRWRTLNPSLPLVASVDSRYENISIGGREGQYDVFGSGQYYFSFPDPYGSGAAAHMIMCEHPSPRRVLLVGGGVGGALPAVLAHRPSLLVYVELDPELIRTAEPFLDAEGRRALRDHAVRIIYGDGRRYIKRTPERFDMVIVGMPDPSTAMLNRFYTREFFEEARAALAPGGVFATRLSAPSDYYGGDVRDYAGSVCATLRSVFPFVVVAPGEENYFFACASPGVITEKIPILRRRWEERGIRTGVFTPYHFSAWWLPERVAFTRRALESRAGARINTDFRPVTYYYNLILWAKFSGSAISSVLRSLERRGLAWYLAPVLVLWALRLLWLAVARRTAEERDAFHALLAIAAVGCTAMGIEIVLIFAFQNVYGYVYRMIGLIVALFMAGLACGGFAGTRFAGGRERRWTLWLSGLEWALALFALALPRLVRLVTPLPAPSEYLFLSLVGIAGLLTGAAFPIAGRICLSRAPNTGRTAARVNGFDHLGACAGSLLTGVLLVPLLGLDSTCVFLAVVNAACATLLLQTLYATR